MDFEIQSTEHREMQRSTSTTRPTSLGALDNPCVAAMAPTTTSETTMGPKPVPATAPLGDDDIEKLFSGAPHYIVRAQSYFPGAPHPSVAFLYDEDLCIRDLTDHVQVEAAAWSGVTLWPHLTRDLNRNAEARRDLERSRKAHFHVRCRERPNMLSMQGLEKGTIGYQAALELSVSDSLEEEQFGFESIGTKARAVVDARERMLSEGGWLHRIPLTELLDRLRSNAKLYRNNTIRERPCADSYADLFTFLRKHPKMVLVDKKVPHSMSNQISALLKCLGSPNVWIDLSHVEWRIRLGQILWGNPHGDELDDESCITDAGSPTERAEEKYWLLLQILISSELLIRLDAITDGEEMEGASFRSIDVVSFERAATSAVKWSLLLARSWMDNIEIVVEEPELIFSKRSKTRRGSTGSGTGSGNDSCASVSSGRSWLASIASTISHSETHNRGSRPPSPPHFYTIRGRHGQRQVDGLIHFARKLMWPGIDAYERRIYDNARSMANAPVALQSPLSVPLQRQDSKQDSYFGAWDITCQRGHHKERGRAQRRRMAAALHSSGWLSKSYVFGLMMPGDALSHFLMATLLENDSEALLRVGSFANLSSGFVYSEKSFWSTSCIVGRVLAAGNGSAECMGWVSTDITPQGALEGWIHVAVQEVPSDAAKIGKKARLWGKRAIERESSILGSGKIDTLLPTDFTIPHENNYSTIPPSLLVKFEKLELAVPSDDLMHPTPLSEIVCSTTTETCEAPDLPSYPTLATFSVSTEGAATAPWTLSLKYDINFVTAHPCSPSRRVRVLRSPLSPTLQHIDFDGSGAFGPKSRSVYRAGHPLHKSYEYTVIHITDLLRRFEEPLDTLIGVGPSAKPAPNRALVVDCITNFCSTPTSPVVDGPGPIPPSPTVERKGGFSAAAQMHYETRKRQHGSDLEMFVRALCAQRGWNALISRRKRGCLSCAIREAGALSWRVIIRLA